MHVLLQLFMEFFTTGLFAVGGGLATLPFLYEIASKYDWLPIESMPDMIAISESTPGPIGVNMATYAGYNAYGVLGGVVATLALVLPSIIVIILIAKFLQTYHENKYVKWAFSGLRPAVTGLIAAAGWQVVQVSLINLGAFSTLSRLGDVFNIRAIVLFGVLTVLIWKFNKHPLLYIAAAAMVGIVLRF